MTLGLLKETWTYMSKFKTSLRCTKVAGMQRNKIWVNRQILNIQTSICQRSFYLPGLCFLIIWSQQEMESRIQILVYWLLNFETLESSDIAVPSKDFFQVILATETNGHLTELGNLKYWYSGQGQNTYSKLRNLFYSRQEKPH